MPYSECKRYHSRLKRWIDRFNGVATKYLQHYLAWLRYLDSKEYENTASNKKNINIDEQFFLTERAALLKNFDELDKQRKG
jgi:hypothetical protein